MINQDIKKMNKTIEDYLNVFQNGSMLWPKAYTINYNRIDVCYDDSFLVNNQEVKVSKIKIFCLPGEFILGLQFTYSTPKGDVIEGYRMKNNLNETDVKELTLESNEYVVKIWGKCLVSIHEIGFETNLGRKIHYRGGGKLENAFNIESPKGYHFSVFAGSCGKSSLDLTNLTADISPFFGKEYPALNYNLLEHKNIIRLAMDFLTVKENTLFFLLNKEYSKLRFDHYILTNLWTRMIYTCHNQLRKYIKETIKSITDENILKDLEKLKELLKFSKNKVPDPYGNKNYKGWTINGSISLQNRECQRGRKNCYVTSYTETTMQLNLKLSEIYNLEDIRLLNEGLNFLVFGCFFCKGSGKTIASFSVKLEDEEKNKIYERNWKKQGDELLPEFQQVNFIYKRENSENGKLPDLITIRISGKDLKFWSGFYGPYISGCYVRMLPKDSYFEKFSLETQSINESLFTENSKSNYNSYSSDDY